MKNGILMSTILPVFLWGTISFEDRFLNSSQDFYTYNMATLYSFDDAKKFLEENNISQEAFYFEFGEEKKILKVMYGIYHSIEEAQKAKANMSDEMKRCKPRIEKIAIKQNLYNKYNKNNYYSFSTREYLEEQNITGITSLQQESDIFKLQESSQQQKQKSLEIEQKNIQANQLQIAIALFNEKKFDEAKTIFDLLFEENMDDPKINFYIGRCATELKLYDEAIGAFERVLIATPNHTRSLMELGRIYFEQNDLQNAGDLLDEVSANTLPINVQQQVDLLRSLIKAKTKEHHFGGSFMLGVNYDTNVKNDIGTIYYDIGAYTNLQGNEKIKDSSISEVLNLTHKYTPYKSNFSWLNSFLVYNQNYNHTNESDIVFLQYSPSVSYGVDKSEISLNPSYERLIFGGDSLFDSIAIGVKYQTVFADQILFEQNLNTKKQDFTAKHNAMDAMVYEGATTLKFSLLNEDVMGLGMIYSKNKSLNSGRTDVNLHTLGMKIDYSKTLFANVMMSLSGVYKKIYYEDVDVLYGDKREDSVKTFGFNTVVPLSKQISILAGWNLVDNDSNFITNRYKKNSYNFNVMTGF